MWSKWQKGVNDDAIISDWFILTWSGKWLFEDKIISHRCTAEEAKEQNDKRIVQELWQAFDEADIIIAHNLNKFDEKKAIHAFYFISYHLPAHTLLLIRCCTHVNDLPSHQTDLTI